MLTPQELQEKKFRKAAFGGYDMQEIDDFLDSVTGDYERLYKENAILKGKLKTLADKVEEYRASDDDMRRTFAEAKRTAEATVADAKANGSAILVQGELTLRDSAGGGSVTGGNTTGNGGGVFVDVLQPLTVLFLGAESLSLYEQGP